jgi:quercetin dioxygenase-like cupin family protein
MQFYDFTKNKGMKITKFDSDFVMSRIVRTNAQTHIGVMYLEPNGLIGYHQATMPQLLLILNGEGYVRSETDEFFKVQQGMAVFWDKGEWHETKTDEGLTVLVIESEELNPAQFMALVNN